MLTGVADVSMLWITSPICGLLYGANWSLMPALASEFFGLSHFGVNYCVLSTSIGIGSFLVSNVLVSSQSSRPPEDRWAQAKPRAAIGCPTFHWNWTQSLHLMAVLHVQCGQSDHEMPTLTWDIEGALTGAAWQLSCCPTHARNFLCITYHGLLCAEWLSSACDPRDCFGKSELIGSHYYTNTQTYRPVQMGRLQTRKEVQFAEPTGRPAEAGEGFLQA